MFIDELFTLLLCALKSLGKPFLFLTIVPKEKTKLPRRTLERLTDVKKLLKIFGNSCQPDSL